MSEGDNGHRNPETSRLYGEVTDLLAGLTADEEWIPNDARKKAGLFWASLQQPVCGRQVGLVEVSADDGENPLISFLPDGLGLNGIVVISSGFFDPKVDLSYRFGEIASVSSQVADFITGKSARLARRGEEYRVIEEAIGLKYEVIDAFNGANDPLD